MLLKCYNCLEFKEETDFSTAKNRTRNNHSTICKSCHYFKYGKNRINKCFKRNKANYNEWAKAYRQLKINKDYEKNFRKSYLGTIKGHASKLLACAKRRAEVKHLDFNLTSEWVQERIKPMICEVTHLPLTLDKYENRTYRVNPFNPSIDRIDCLKGYTKDNCRIVCWIYNLAKADFNDEIVLKMASALVINNS